MEEERERERRDREVGRGYHDRNDNRSRAKGSPESAPRRPTMLLAQLPKTINEDEVKRLIPTNLKVEEVAFLPPPAPGSDKRFAAAIVAVAADTPMSDVDSCVSALQGKYLGFGCYLKISRHITSAVGGLGSGVGSHNLGGMADFQPFGAKPFVRDAPTQHSMKNAPPPDSLDNPYAYQAYGQRNQGPAPLVVTVSPPSDLKLLQAVNKTVENTIKFGSVFEKALLTSPQIQHDEHWAWIFDTTCQANVYYRWLIYEHFAGKTARSAMSGQSEEWLRSPEGQFAKKNGLVKVFDQGPLWQPPRERPKFEFTFDFEDIVDDSEYISSDDESGDEKEFLSKHDGPRSSNAGSANYLNPYRRAKLTYLLHRLPDTLAYLRRGDVARITAFVVANAGSGADEIVAMLLENIFHPYSRCVKYSTPLEDLDPDDPDDHEALEKRARNEEEKKRSDASNAKLIALYCVSDALQASSTSGVRDAWKYRGLFESALLSQNVFAHLGRLEKEFSWGRMKAEQWKRKVGVVLGLWEKWSVFSVETQKAFKEAFLNPPALFPASVMEESRSVEMHEKESGKESENKTAKWKSGTSTPIPPEAAPTSSTFLAKPPVADGNPTMDIDTAAPATQPQQPAPQPSAEVAAAAKPSIADRMAALKTKTRAARPTAADLLDKASEPPIPAPAPKISVGSFKMSLGLGGSAGGGAGTGAAKAKGGVEDVDMDLGSEDEGQGRGKGKGKQRAEDVFMDSD